MKAAKYIILFFVFSNAGILALNGMGVTDTMGIDPTACAQGAAADTQQTAADTGGGIVGGGLETLWGFYSSIVGTFDTLLSTINPAKAHVACAVGPDLDSLVTWTFAGADLLVAFAILSLYRGIEI